MRVLRVNQNSNVVGRTAKLSMKLCIAEGSGRFTVIILCRFITTSQPFHIVTYDKLLHIHSKLFQSLCSIYQ